MPKITAIIHANNHAACLARTLDSLRVCDEVLVIDHKSDDNTVMVARKHGANSKPAINGVGDGIYVVDARHDWILCLLPSEVLSKRLQKALAEWKDLDPGNATGFATKVRCECNGGWENCGTEMRLINRNQINCIGALPPNVRAPHLPGVLLRYKH